MSARTRVSVGVAATAAAVGAMLIPATAASAAPPPLTITSHEPAGFNLQDGSLVDVSGTGFDANAPIGISECSAIDQGIAGCDTSHAQVTQTDANGAFSQANFVVHTGAIGNGTCGAASTCFIVASTDFTGQDLSKASAGQIVFDNLQASPRTSLKNGQAVNLSGAGFTGGSTVYVSECTSADPTKALQKCDVNHLETYTTQQDGTFSGVFHNVHSGTVGSDGSKCNPGGGCILAATDNVFNPGAGHIGGAVVTLAPVVKTALNAKATKSHVAKGKHFAVKGVLSAAGKGLNGATVKLYKVTKSGLKKLATKKTATNSAGTKGAYKFGGLTQKHTTKYKVKFAGGTLHSTTYTASTSKTVKVST